MDLHVDSNDFVLEETGVMDFQAPILCARTSQPGDVSLQSATTSVALV